MGIKPWDIAAGGLLVREAGGRATSTEGDEESLSTGAIVVSNGLLHEQTLRVLRINPGRRSSPCMLKLKIRAGPSKSADTINGWLSLVPLSVIPCHFSGFPFALALGPPYNSAS